MITIRINGELRQFEQAITIDTLIELMGLSGRRIALECNGEIIPRAKFQTHHLDDGDKLEIVVAVGGG